MEHRHDVDGLELAYGCRGGPELDAVLGGEAGECLEELEYACLAGLEVTEDFEVHEQVDDLLLGRSGCYP